MLITDDCTLLRGASTAKLRAERWVAAQYSRRWEKKEVGRHNKYINFSLYSACTLLLSLLVHVLVHKTVSWGCCRLTKAARFCLEPKFRSIGYEHLQVHQHFEAKKLNPFIHHFTLLSPKVSLGSTGACSHKPVPVPVPVPSRLHMQTNWKKVAPLSSDLFQMTRTWECEFLFDLAISITVLVVILLLL